MLSNVLTVPRKRSVSLLFVVVVVMTSPSGICLYEGTKKIQPDSESGGICLSLVIVDSHFIDWGHHSRAAVVAHS